MRNRPRYDRCTSAGVVCNLLAVLSILAATPALALPPGVKKDLPPPPADAPPPAPDPLLRAVIDSPDRPAADRARDVYRHPYESLQFWGLRPGMTVLDLQPGGGYWTAILAPYLQRTHGVYITSTPDLADPKLPDGARRMSMAFKAKFADPSKYGEVRYVVFTPTSGPTTAPASVDLILSTREIHDWIGQGYLDRGMAGCFAALKPGGILAVEDHRADPLPQEPGAANGYVAVQAVVEAAAKAGFELVATSEINANPKDDKMHPFGVWTLPPSRQSAPNGQPPDPSFDHSKYDAIGESDRMTLRFRKPA